MKSYAPKSDIFKEAWEKEVRICQQDIESQNKRIESFKEDINRNEKHIKELQKKLEVEDQKKREIICKLREIMENANNHENELICNKLKGDKEAEYIKEIANLNNLAKNSTYKLYWDSIQKEREAIGKTRKQLREAEKLKQIVVNHAMERGRKEILGRCIDIIKDNETYKQGIKFLKNIIDNIEKEENST